VKGKLIRRSLRTNLITVAKLQLADLEKVEPQKVQTVTTIANGRMTFGPALKVFKKRFKENPHPQGSTVNLDQSVRKSAVPRLSNAPPARGPRRC
jgi:hypothetical protein